MTAVKFKEYSLWCVYVYNPLNNRYDAKTEIEKLEKMV